MTIVIENYEKALSQRCDEESMQLRVLLGDSSIESYTALPSRNMRSTLCDQVDAHLCQYRILDFELGCYNDHAPNPSSAQRLPTRRPQKIKSIDFKAVNQSRLIKKLSNWDKILKTFMKHVVQVENEPLSVVQDINSPFRRSFGHLQCLSEGFAKEEYGNLMQNFRAAALHLTFFQETAYAPNTLPDIPLTEETDDNESSLMQLLPRQDLDKYEDHAHKKLCTFLEAHTPGEIRRPLHMSLLISMLLLLIPSKLVKSSFPRSAIHLVSFSDVSMCLIS